MCGVTWAVKVGEYNREWKRKYSRRDIYSIWNGQMYLDLQFVYNDNKINIRLTAPKGVTQVN